MNSGFLKLNWRDLLNGLIVSVGADILLTVQAWITTPEFNIFNMDWADGKVLLNVAVLAGLSYLGKKLLTDKENRLGGII